MYRNYYHNLPRTFVPDGNDKREVHSVEKRITFINRTHKDVVVCERSNLKIVVPPTPVFGKEHEIIIRVEYQIHHQKVKLNAELILDRMQLIGDHLRIFKNAFSCSQNNTQFGGINFTVEYPISEKVLEEYGGIVYFKEIDTVFCLNHIAECPDHPFSYEAEMRSETLNGVEVGPAYGLNIDLYINDPNNKYGDRFVNVFGKVHRVRTIKLYDRREGIYLNKLINGKVQNFHYAFADAEKEIDLFRVEDEALSNGHVDLILKKNLAELENKNLILKKELEESKILLQRREVDIDARKAELEREKEEWKSKKERDDLERKSEYERMRDYYERRSFERKDRTEAIKYIPTLMVGLGALFVGIKNILNEKDK